MDGSIAVGLLRRLAAEAWAPGATLPPGRELAAEFGVSHRTVRKAVRRAARYGLVRIRPRQPVLVLPGAKARAERLLARLAARPSQQRVAILLPEFCADLTDPFYAALVGRVVEEAARRNVRADIVRWPLLDQLAVARSLASSGYAVALCIGLRSRYLASLYLMIEKGFPVVVYNRVIPGVTVPTIRGDDYAAGWSIAGHLAKLGHRNLCMVTSPSLGITPDALDLSAGWFDYLSETGLLETSPAPLHVVPWQCEDMERFSPVFVDFVRSDQGPTAIVFNTITWARIFFGDPRFAHLRVPEDISVAVNAPGPVPPSIPNLPPLTTIQTRFQRCAECLMDAVDRILAGDLRPTTLRLPLDILITDSIGPPKNQAGL